jgi:eukaryotic-like serine/threonine-protein kinase
VIPASFVQTVGRFQVQREIGRGAMGAVYLALDTANQNHPVALKTMALAKAFQGDQLREAQRRFFRESEIAKRLRHPGIVTIFEAAQDPSQQLAYIAMEYLGGGTLEQHTQTRLPILQVLELGQRIALALHYAHTQGVVHRDIKPANVMFDPPTQSVKVTDFGIAHVADTYRTQTGLVLGTLAYMSPEQLTGARLDGRSDLYSLGVMLYQLLTGQLPHEADSTAALMRHIATQPVADIRLSRHDISEPVSRFISTALQKRPQSRYPDGQKMAEALQVLLSS